MVKTARRTTEEREALADAAYERGWVDSLDARYSASSQPTENLYWYSKGWGACADYRWLDPNNRGTAPDRTYREPRK